VQLHKVAAQADEIAEQIQTAGNRKARKIDFQEFGVAGAIHNAVEDGISVVQDIYG
jgi:hypothetical protein